MDRKERCKIDYIHRSRRRKIYMLEHGGMRPMMPTEAWKESMLSGLLRTESCQWRIGAREHEMSFAEETTPSAALSVLLEGSRSAILSDLDAW